jgi:NAD+ synthase
MGFSYESLDRYLLSGDIPDEVRSKIKTMASTSNHKRSMPPIAEF